MTDEERHEIEATLALCGHCESEDHPMLITTQAGRHWIVCRDCQVQTAIGTLDEVRTIWNRRRMQPSVRTAINEFAKACGQMGETLAIVMRAIETEGNGGTTK